MQLSLNSLRPRAGAPSLKLWAAWLLIGSGEAVAAQCPAFLNHDFQKLHSPEHVNLCAAANPVFLELARQTKQPSWNFNKYLVRPDGTVAEHFDADVTPDSPQLEAAIERLLASAGSHP